MDIILNRFEVSCKSKRTILCYTRERESKRAVLITLNYELSEEEEKFKNESKEQIILLTRKLSSIGDLFNASSTNINSINNSFTENFSPQLKDLFKIFQELNQSFEGLKELWETQDFTYFEKELIDFKDKIENFEVKLKKLTSDVILDISLYNSLIENLTSSKQLLQEISQISLTNSLCGELNNLVVDFNESINQFKVDGLLEKMKIVEDISFKVKQFYEKILSTPLEMVSLCHLDVNITDEDLAKIEIVSIDNPSPVISLKEPTSICCFFGQCEECCDEKCSDENYPVIFLHGHSINKALPADYSFDSFSEIKEQLVDENYIDAGAVVISSTEEREGLWGKINVPIMVTASYFFDEYKKDSGVVIVSSNVDNFDTYAIRLRDIVELVKYRTNKNKVILVAQSGGGLVTRRYVQIFGADDVDKVILITVPNHGIDEKTKGYCVLFGPEATCNDMDESSIFINKLNNAPTEEVPTYNFIGIGCDMGDETGDGILKNSSQYLDYATNYYMEGSCNELSFEFFHENIVYPSKYPEVYNLLEQILKE